MGSHLGEKISAKERQNFEEFLQYRKFKTLSNTGLASVEEYAEDNDMVGGNKNPAIKKGRKPRKSSMRRLIDVDDGFGFGSEEDEAETNLHEKRLSRKRNSAYDNTEKPAKRNTRGEYRTRAENALVLNLALTEKYRQYLIGKNENNAIPSFSARALEARQEFCAELLMDYGLKIRPDAVHRAIRYKMEIVRRAHAEDPRVVRETGDVPITPPPSLAEHLHPLYDALYHSFRNTKSGYMSNIVVNDESIIAEEKCHRFYQDSESYSQEQVICEGTVESEAPPHKNRKTSVSSQNEEVVGLLSKMVDLLGEIASETRLSRMLLEQHLSKNTNCSTVHSSLSEPMPAMLRGFNESTVKNEVAENDGIPSMFSSRSS